MKIPCDILGDFVHGAYNLVAGQVGVELPEFLARDLAQRGLVRVAETSHPPVAGGASEGKAQAAGEEQTSSASPAAPVSSSPTSPLSADGEPGAPAATSSSRTRRSAPRRGPTSSSSSTEPGT